MNEKEKFLEEKLNEEDVGKVAGGRIFKVEPPKEGTAKYKSYVFIDDADRISQYDTFDEAWEKEKQLKKENMEFWEKMIGYE